MMIGTLATMVIVARIEVGVTVALLPCAFAKASAAEELDIAVLDVDSIFISSYCSVLRLGVEELYRKTSNQEFH